MLCNNLEVHVSLDKLMKPESVAIVGVSEIPGKFGYSARLNMMNSTIKNVYYVHPSREELDGKKCYKKLSDLPEMVDCAILCTPAHTIIPLLNEVGELGIPAAVVFASGFSEENSLKAKKLEKELVAVAEQYGTKVLGPNCLGLYNAVDNIHIWGMGQGKLPKGSNKGIGVVAQSGSVVAEHIVSENLPVAYGISSGNGNSVALEEFVDFLVDQEEVTVISLYLEGLKKPEIFINALQKAAEKRKPVVILKAGRTALGAASAASHTGNLAGSNKSYEALFKKYGVIQVDDFDQLYTMVHILSVLDGNFPKTPNFGGLTLSGGQNTLFTDLGVAAGLDYLPFPEETKSELGKFIPGFSTPHNPCDATTAIFFNEDAIIGVIKAVNNTPDIGLIFLGASLGEVETPVWRHYVNSVAKAKEVCKKPIVLIPPREENINKDLRKTLETSGVPVLASPSTSFKCLRLLADYVKYQPNNRLLVFSGQENNKQEVETVVLSELDSKLEVAKYGVPIPKQMIAHNHEELKLAIQDMNFPLVLKINSPDILHKSDVGGVKLNIHTEVEAINAYEKILSSVKTSMPKARLEGILVQEMVPAGIEIIIGISNDPQFGPMLLVGLGGVFVEIFKDTALYPAPINEYEALEMLQSLKSFKLLIGYRGEKRYDVKSLCELLVHISNYAYENRMNLKEMDLNPVFVYPEGQGVVVADALIVNYKKA